MNHITRALLLIAAAALPQFVTAQYDQTNLTSYQPNVTRDTDPNLNGWGMARLPGEIYAVANTCPGVVSFYDLSGKPLPFVVTVPPARSQPFGPTGSPAGLVYKPTRDFAISTHGKSAPALLLIDTLDGTISGWNPNVDPTNAIIIVDNSTEPVPASYTGLALTYQVSKGSVLYAADSGNSGDLSNNRIDMLTADSSQSAPSPTRV